MIKLRKKTFKSEAEMLEWLDDKVPNECDRMTMFNQSLKNLTVHYMEVSKNIALILPVNAN